MLKTWSVSNFKSISTTRVINQDETETGELTLKPLTVFCGANSSGKSSLIQSILLLAQTMRFQGKQYPLILNGAFISLGTFDDIIKKNGKEMEIKFSIDAEKTGLSEKRDYDSGIKDKSYYRNDPDCFTNQDYPLSLFTDSPSKAVISDISLKCFFCKGKMSEVLPGLSKFELSYRFIQRTFSSERDTSINNIYKFTYSCNNVGEKGQSVNETLEGPDGKEIDKKCVMPLATEIERKSFFPVKFSFTGINTTRES